MENKKLSAVEWLVEDLTRLGHNFKLYKKEIEQAKAMEQQQIIEAFNSGQAKEASECFWTKGNYYYEQKYGQHTNSDL